MEHYKLALAYFRNEMIIPRDWKDEDVDCGWTKNMLIHPFDKRNYVITHKKTNEKVYASLDLEELNKIENKNKKEDIHWKYVFNGSLKHYGDIWACFDVVKQTGYEYFTFNGQVLKVLKDNSFVETGQKDSDLI